MSRVEIYRRVDGMKIQKWLALHPSVQAELTVAARGVYEKVSAQHAAYQRSEATRRIHANPTARAHGRSVVTFERGRIDRYIIVNDEGSNYAAGIVAEITGAFDGFASFNNSGYWANFFSSKHGGRRR